MPELATGASNLLIVLSAVLCLRCLDKTDETGLWRLFFCLAAAAATVGAAVHCLVLPEALELALWMAFDLCAGPLLVLLPLAARRQRGPLPPAWLAGAGWLLAGALLRGLEERLSFSRPPTRMRGLPLKLVCAGLTALALMGLNGILG